MRVFHDDRHTTRGCHRARGRPGDRAFPVLYQGTSGWEGVVEVRARLEGYREAVLRVPREPNGYHLAESVLFPPAAAWGWYLPDGVTFFLEPAPRPTPNA